MIIIGQQQGISTIEVQVPVNGLQALLTPRLIPERQSIYTNILWGESGAAVFKVQHVESIPGQPYAHHRYVSNSI